MRAVVTGIAGAPTRILSLEVGPDFRFCAGQYVEILLPGGHRLPLSIASAPGDLPDLDFVYRSTPGDAAAAAMDRALADRTPLDLSRAFGEIRVDRLRGPLLFLAGGTGIAQARGVLRHLAGVQNAFPVTLLWCLDETPDERLAGELGSMPGCTLKISVDAARDAQNRGIRWLVVHLATTRYDRIIASGSPPFVYAVADALAAAGIDHALESDVFSYVPR